MTGYVGKTAASWFNKLSSDEQSFTRVKDQEIHKPLGWLEGNLKDEKDVYSKMKLKIKLTSHHC